MRKSVRRPLAALLFALAALGAAAPGAALAEAPAKQTLTLTNTAQRLADCALIVDGKIRNLLKIHTGKTWADDFDPRRTLQLVCERAVKDAVWRVKPGTTYRFVDAAGRLDLAEGAAE